MKEAESFVMHIVEGEGGRRTAILKFWDGEGEHIADVAIKFGNIMTLLKVIYERVREYVSSTN